MMNRIIKWVIVASRLMVLTTVFCGATVLSSCTSYNDDNPTATIQGGRWDPQVQTALNGLDLHRPRHCTGDLGVPD